MNKAITEGLVLMPPPFSAGLNLWSREDGTPGQGSYLAQSNAAFVPSDQDFGGCLELLKTASTQKLRCFQQIPIQPGLYLRVTAKVKAMSGALPSVRIAAWAGSISGTNVVAADQQGPSVTLPGYGTVVTVTAIIGSGNRQGVDMIWGTAPVYGHFGLDLTGATGGVVRIEDITIEDVTDVFHAAMFDWVDVRDYGAIGDGVTDDRAAFDAADTSAAGKTVVVSPGTYYIATHLTFENPVKFEGTITMPPPIPKRPAKKPVHRPRTANSANSKGSMIIFERGSEERCLQVPPDRHPEPGVQVGEGRLALGSSDAR